MAELKPCECEGFNAEIEGPFLENKWGWCVCCPDCGRQTPIYLYKQAAIDAWNKRSQSMDIKQCREIHNMVNALEDAEKVIKALEDEKDGCKIYKRLTINIDSFNENQKFGRHKEAAIDTDVLRLVLKDYVNRLKTKMESL